MAVQKTTVYLDVDAYRRIKAIAKAERRAPADLVREAVAEYAGRHARRAAPRSIGVGRSKRGDVGERAEELLAGFGGTR
jgi:predicted transcriptional regulator